MAVSRASLDSTLTWRTSDSVEEQLIYWICTVLVASFAVVCVILVAKLEVAYYGRYNDRKSGNDDRRWIPIDVNGKIAWVVQEIPNLFAVIACWVWGDAAVKYSPGNLLLITLFAGHYINRTLIYPLQIRGGKDTPLELMLAAFLFCCINGYIQIRSLTAFIIVPVDMFTLPIGCALWALGLCINMHSDYVLRNLRQPGETGYKIPHGGAFAYVSGANFLGEIIEWFGFAIASNFSLPALTFALTTAFNIGPRALNHHDWYLLKFKDAYPTKRKALIPFIF